MGLNFSENVCIMALICTAVLFASLIMKFTNRSDKKNKTLIQLYLELKFLYRNLTHSLDGILSQNFCVELIESIKEYYNLEEIIVIDSVKMEFKTTRPKVLKKEIYDFLQCNLSKIKKDFQKEEFITNKIKINNKGYVLYIVELAPNTDSDGFIVCVENSPTLLSKNELLGLKSNINLLRTGLFCQ